ncbi:MAG: hypothetical protein M1840_001858 [Geoglossum simile]|nr:MAG: hypothetical protein M1840_001858 [Geoglossum simile]
MHKDQHLFTSVNVKTSPKFKGSRGIIGTEKCQSGVIILALGYNQGGSIPKESITCPSQVLDELHEQEELYDSRKGKSEVKSFDGGRNEPLQAFHFQIALNESEQFTHLMPTERCSSCMSVGTVVAEYLTFNIAVECLLDKEGFFAL